MIGSPTVTASEVEIQGLERGKQYWFRIMGDCPYYQSLLPYLPFCESVGLSTTFDGIGLGIFQIRS